ncbi:MAG: ribosome assembly cofactor RimP [Syntrophothermus sp.]
MITKEIIEDLVNQQLAGTDRFLVDISVQPGNKIFVYIDSERNINVTDCLELNRSIETVLDRDTEDFDLTVSSYGIDRPLRNYRQYLKNVGREMEIIQQDGTKLAGVLVKADQEKIEIEHPVKKKKEIQKPNSVIDLINIKTGKIILKFGK